jgi:hypothetical protein
MNKPKWSFGGRSLKEELFLSSKRTVLLFNTCDWKKVQNFCDYIVRTLLNIEEENK